MTQSEAKNLKVGDLVQLLYEHHTDANWIGFVVDVIDGAQKEPSGDFTRGIAVMWCHRSGTIVEPIYFNKRDSGILKRLCLVAAGAQ